jgi:hypothetical protein
MKKDWVVLGGCALLFGAGIVWGQMWPKKDFFAVADIHDLAEILSSMATVAAVFIAMTAWRKQLRAQHDHDLARRIAIAGERFKRVTLEIVVDAHFCGTNSNLQYSSESLIERIRSNLRDRMTAHDAEMSSLNATLLEARALWGDQLDKAYEEIFSVSKGAYYCVNHFIGFLNESGNPDHQDGMEARITKFDEELSRRGLTGGPDDISEKISSMTSTADRFLKHKLRV